MPKIHPTALVDPAAELADDVEIGPFCVVEDHVKLGAGTVLRPHVIIRRYTTMGANNLVDSFTVIGGLPQDLKFEDATVSYVRIGDNNVFREGVTISRPTIPDNSTLMGNNNYLMTGAHCGHDTTTGNNVIMVNRAALGGHSTLHSGAILSAHVSIHQFCWVGEMAIGQGNCITTNHVPPYVIFSGTGQVVGLNAVGLRRNPDLTEEDRRQIKEAFRLTYRDGLTRQQALDEMDKCTDWRPAAILFREFIRRVIAAKKPFNRPLAKFRSRSAGDEE